MSASLSERLTARLQLDRLRRLAEASRAVRPASRFLLAEVPKRRGEGTYRVGAARTRMRLRHPESDEYVLHEVFARGVYAPPAEVLEAVPRPRRIVDLGGYVGLSSAYFLERFPSARVTTV